MRMRKRENMLENPDIDSHVIYVGASEDFNFNDEAAALYIGEEQ